MVGSNLRLYGYTDANYTNGPDKHKSTSAYTFLLGRGAISLCSTKQLVVALLIIEAEYIVASTVAQEAIWLRHFFETLRSYCMYQI